jgi:DNA-binding transcriptional LysR family regulator
MDFDLRLLRHARALAEEGSFARASRTLHLTQPALSRSIQELERRTGIKLFDRAQGRVEPTDLGRVFLAQARDLLGQAEALDRSVAMLRGSGTGRLAVGSGTIPTAMFMAGALGAFLQRNPNVGVRLVSDNWVALVAALRRRELDFIVASHPPAEEAGDLVAKPLALREACFLVRPGHPLLGRRDLAFADVAAFPVVSTGRFPAEITAIVVDSRKGEDAGRPFPDVACESHEMMRAIVRATDHVLLSGLAANVTALEAGELVALPFSDPRISAKFAVLRLQARTLPPIAEELIADVVAADRAATETERRLKDALHYSRAPVQAAPRRRLDAAVAGPR